MFDFLIFTIQDWKAALPFFVPHWPVHTPPSPPTKKSLGSTMCPSRRCLFYFWVSSFCRLVCLLADRIYFQTATKRMETRQKYCRGSAESRGPDESFRRAFFSFFFFFFLSFSPFPFFFLFPFLFLFHYFFLFFFFSLLPRFDLPSLSTKDQLFFFAPLESRCK